MQDEPTRTRAGNRWVEAVDAQLDLIRFWSSPIGRLYGKGFTEYESEHVEYGTGSVQHPVSDEMKRDGLGPGDGLAIREYHAIKAAPTYWVSRELGFVIDKAAKTLPAAPLSVLELPTASGFVFLEKPIYVEDINGDMVGIKIFRWHPQTVTLMVGEKGKIHLRALYVSWYGDRDDPDDESLARMRERNPRALEGSPRWSMWHHAMWVWAGRSEDGRAVFESDDRWSGERHILDTEGLIPDPAEDMWLWIEGRPIATWMNTFFRFVCQDVTRISHGQLPRALKHRMQRAKMPEWGDVRVIDLRRIDYVGRAEGETDDEAWMRWTHRWRVNGHWRRQWIGSEKDGTRRQVWKWIDSFVKGPDYLPVVEKDDIRRVVR